MGRCLPLGVAGLLLAGPHPHDLASHRAASLGYPKSLFSWIVWFCTMIPLEGVHPLEGGMVRLKFRRDRRHGMPRESPGFSIRDTSRSAQSSYTAIGRSTAASRRSTTRSSRRRTAAPIPTWPSRRRRATNSRASTLSRHQRRGGRARPQAQPRSDRLRRAGESQRPGRSRGRDLLIAARRQTARTNGDHAVTVH